jgi:CheY-like chemotaxis protein
MDSERTILVVDDSESAVASLEIALALLPGVRVTYVPSATEAIRRMGEETTAVAAVITDLCMPGVDGYALIRHIRAHRVHFAIPIVVVTGDTEPGTAERTTRLGANAFFAKPFSPTAVRHTLEELLYGATT